MPRADLFHCPTVTVALAERMSEKRRRSNTGSPSLTSRRTPRSPAAASHRTSDPGRRGNATRRSPARAAVHSEAQDGHECTVLRRSGVGARAAAAQLLAHRRFRLEAVCAADGALALIACELMFEYRKPSAPFDLTEVDLLSLAFNHNATRQLSSFGEKNIGQARFRQPVLHTVRRLVERLSVSSFNLEKAAWRTARTAIAIAKLLPDLRRVNDR